MMYVLNKFVTAAENEAGVRWRYSSLNHTNVSVRDCMKRRISAGDFDPSDVT